MKRCWPLICLLSLMVSSVWAAEEGPWLDSAPRRAGNLPALQNGARLFANYCLSCHSASTIRYSRLQALGLTEKQIEENLNFSHGRVGDPMVISMDQKDGKEWFGVPPPDLSIIARARGSDWLFTYLRSFYRDPSRPTGWNNRVFNNVSMPHVLWQLQGDQIMDKEGQLKLVRQGQMTPDEYDEVVADLTGFLTWAGEPDAGKRKFIGGIVLIVLFVLFLLTYALKKEYWKDVH